jgi:Fe-S-cluster containining protein
MATRDIRELQRAHVCRDGAPTINRVDLAIFRRRYSAHCMSNLRCHDSCCAHGADVDAENVERILSRAGDLERHVGRPLPQWFNGEWTADPEMPGGRHTRTRVVAGTCAFLDRAGRGCLLHSFGHAIGRDYHETKPMICALFPATFDCGLLRACYEVNEDDLVCLGEGPTVYQGVREEVRHYLGRALVEELDTIENELLARMPRAP